MRRYYGDILAAAGFDPIWFDEHGVPRFREFTPDAIAEVYASECAELRISCRGCGRDFVVAMSTPPQPEWFPLASAIASRAIHYGEPPNMRCCAEGPALGAITRRVLSYHTRDLSQRTDEPGRGWARRSELAIDINPSWMDDPPSEAAS